MKIVITGGGTGGHLAIARALAKSAQKKGFEAIYIGSVSGQDRKYFENSPLFREKHFFKTQGVVNKRGFAKLLSLFAIFRAFLHARAILKKEHPSLLFSVGGFSAAPASFAAISLGVPLFIHEQNAKTGKLNTILKRYATTFFSSYDEDSPIKSYPVEEIFFQKSRIRKKIETIIFLGGSQGARFINDLALEVAKELKQKGVNVIHQAGEKDYKRVQNGYKELGIEVKVISFSDNIAELMERSDLAVSRSGASTLWELTANALPALFIPYPYAAGDHQYYNAKYLVDNDLAWLKRQEENPKELLLSILDADLEAKSKKLSTLIKPGAADAILEYAVKKVQND